MKSPNLEQVEQCVRRGRYKRAIQLLQRAVGQGHSSAECYLRLAELYCLTDNWCQAISTLRNAVYCVQDPAPLRERLVELLIESGDYTEAIHECQAWAHEMPDHPTPLEHLLDVYCQKMDYDHALEVANRLVYLQPQSPDYRLRRAHLLDNMGRLREAIEDYQHLAWNETVPLEVMHWAQLELERLDADQLDLLVPLLMEDPLFRLKFLRNPLSAVQERGFRFSAWGETLLEQLTSTLRTIPKAPKPYGCYC